MSKHATCGSFRIARGDRLDTFDTAGHVQRREGDQLFQIVEQRGRDDFRRDMIRSAVDDSMPDGVEMRQLQALELVEQRVDGDLRARELAIGLGEQVAVGVVNSDFAAARSDSIRSAFSHDRFGAAGKRVQRKLARRRTDIDAEDGVTGGQAWFLSCPCSTRPA